MTAKHTKPCNACNKSSFSLLLLRPSPLAKSQASGLVPLGAPAIVSDDSLVSGLVPMRQPTESRYALRLLREGYVHIHIPKPSNGFRKNWLVYRVAPNADIIAEDNAIFSTHPYQACSRQGHNAAGMKLVEIPQAHLLVGQTIWIAYSANLWNDKLKAQNAANPKAMQPLVIGGGNKNSFQPMASNLSKHVLECKLRLLNINGALVHDFPFCSQSGNVEQLADNLKAAAARHPQTKDKELAVVLADPVGLASELNALRLYRHRLAEAEMAKPENAHPLTSLQILDGLRQSVIDSTEARSVETVSPVMGHGTFQDIMRVKPNPRGWPEGTRWAPLSEREDIHRHGYGMGRVVFPDQEARRAAWVRRQTAATWSKYESYLDTAAITAWSNRFEKKMRDDHGTPQARFEADWWAARTDGRFGDYFALHFDPADANAPLAAHSAGTVHAQEVARALTPQPLALGPVQEGYASELMRPLAEPQAMMLRALVGNQQDLFGRLQAYFDSSNADGLLQSRNDKLYDLSTGAFKKAAEALGPTDVKYGWLLREAFGTASMAIGQSLAAVVAGVSLTGLGAAAKVTIAQDKLRRLFAALMTTQALSMARQSVSAGSRLQSPALVSVRLAPVEARRLLQQRGAVTGDRGLPNSRALEQQARPHGGMISLTLLSDNLTLARLGYDPKVVIAAGAGTIMLNEPQFAQLLQRQHTRVNQAALLLQEAVRGGRGILSLDGRIGIVAGLINGVMMVDNFGKAWEKGDMLDIANTFDSFFGTVAGAAQVTEAAVGASVAGRLGQDAVDKSVAVLGLRMAVAGAGAASSWAMLAGQVIQFQRARHAGDSDLAKSYFASGVSTFGFASTSSLIFVGAFADFMVARGSTAAIWQAISMRLGVQALKRGSLAVLGVGLSGWGLIFLGGALFFEGVAFVLTPDALQAHIRRTRFGKGPDKFASLAEEFTALERLMQATPAKTEAPVLNSISGLGAMP